MLGSITVRLNNGQRYAAQNLQTLRKGWGGDYEKTVLVFECSGVLTSFPVEDVAGIELNAWDPAVIVTITADSNGISFAAS